MDLEDYDSNKEDILVDITAKGSSFPLTWIKYVLINGIFAIFITPSIFNIQII